MAPDPDDPLEAEGVLNPACGRTPDGRLHLLARVVAAGNISRVMLAEVVVDGGVPVGVERRGVVLAPDCRGSAETNHGGVEDPRVTYIDRLGLHVMTYVAFGPLGPRVALAVSRDLTTWERLGPVHFAYEPEWGIDFNLYPNKDALFFPEPIAGPGGEPCTRCSTGRCGELTGWGSARSSRRRPVPTGDWASGSPTSRRRRSTATRASSPGWARTGASPSASSRSRAPRSAVGRRRSESRRDGS